MNNVRLKYRGRTKKVKLAVLKANHILASEAFYRQINTYRKFDNSAISPDQIARLLRESDYEITVKVNWIFPDLQKSEFDRIVINGWDFSDNLATGVNLLITETVRAIDKVYDIIRDDEELSQHRNSSAPLVIGAIAELMAG